METVTIVYVAIILCLCSSTNTADNIAPTSRRRPWSGMIRTPESPESPESPGNIVLPDEQFYDFQRVNHFDGSDARRWRQRYFVNSTFFSKDGPIFLLLGGEVEANPVWTVEGAPIQYAKMHGAMLIFLEHRYYGKSHPVSDLTAPSLQYLSSRQALADTANFITYFYWWNHLSGNKLIVLGGSYSGSLAVWFRARFPWIVDGAVASSAPIFAKMEFAEYFEAVGDALDVTGTQCKTEIMNATETMFEWWGQPDKRLVMNKIFRLCDKIDHGILLDLTVFFWNLAENFAEIVQYYKDNRAFEGGKGTNITIEQVCNIMTDDTRGNNIQRYADVNSLVLDTYGESCLNLRYTKLAKSLNYTEWNSSLNDGSRQWLYQVCSEFGWFQSSSSTKQPFGSYLFPWNFTTDQCLDVFPGKIFGGEQCLENCDETNMYYGGYDLSVSNVVFVNGDIDPWKNVTVLKPLPRSPHNEIINIAGASHCADMYPPSGKDVPQLTKARDRISQILGKWISR